MVKLRMCVWRHHCG